jgi:hypothetical protein
MFRMLLSLTLLAIITALAPTGVAANAKNYPEWHFDHSDFSVGVADLVEIKGGKPAGLRPKFNNAAKPKMAAPRTKPPVASRQAVNPRSATGRALPSRVQGVNLPTQTREIMRKLTASGAAKLRQGSRQRFLSPNLTKQLTEKRLDSARKFLRSSPKIKTSKSKHTSRLNVEVQRASLKLGTRNTKPVRHYSGVVLPSSSKALVRKLSEMGLKSKPTTTKSGKNQGKINGTSFYFKDGSYVRVMKPSGSNGHRAVFHNNKGVPIDPRTGKVPRPAKALSKREKALYTKGKTHIILSE